MHWTRGVCQVQHNGAGDACRGLTGGASAMANVADALRTSTNVKERSRSLDSPLGLETLFSAALTSFACNGGGTSGGKVELQALVSTLARARAEIRALQRGSEAAAAAYAHELALERDSRAAAEAVANSLRERLKDAARRGGGCRSLGRAAPPAEESDDGGPLPPGLELVVDGLTYRACFERVSTLEQVGVSPLAVPA